MSSDEGIRRVEHLLERLRSAPSAPEREQAAEALAELARTAAVAGDGSITRQLVDALAIQAVTDAERAELVANAQREAARIRYLAHAGAMLASTTEPKETLATLVRLAVPELADWAAVDLFIENRAERLAIAHIDPAKVALVEELGRRYPPNLDDPADGLGQILRTGQPQLVPELPPAVLEAAAKDEEHLRVMRTLGLRSYVCVPIASRGRIRGALTLIAAESGRRFDEHELELALEIARRASIALDVVDVLEELRTAERAARDASSRLERADRRKDEFLAMLGHELRNPLAAIATASHVLHLNGTSAAVIQRARATIARQAAHMKRLLDDLLDVARITRGRIYVERAPVDLAAIAKQSAEDHRAEIEGAGIALAIEIPEQPHMVTGDATRLAQVVANLLHNARKFTPSGGHITVRLAREADDIVLVVRDDGIGLDTDALADLFEPFTKAQGTPDPRESGLGLGLALARGLILQHDGTIEAASDGIGHGATFTVRVPRAEATAQPLAQGSERAESRLRILIVEDDRDGGEMAQLLLQELGHEVELVVDGEAALDRARTFQPALVLCDIGLPGTMDGYAVARALRGAPDLGDPYVVAITGFGLPDHVRRAQDAGFDRFLTKPLATAALSELIATVTRRHA